MLEVGLNFESFWGTFLNIFFSSFYTGIRFFFVYLNDWGLSNAPGLFWFYFISQIIYILIILAIKRELNRFCIFILCLVCPLLAVPALMFLIPNVSENSNGLNELSNKTPDNNLNLPNKNILDKTEKKYCIKCNTLVSADCFSCPNCECKEFTTLNTTRECKNCGNKDIKELGGMLVCSKCGSGYFA